MKKVVVQIIIVILILGALSNMVSASSFNLGVTPDKESIAPGEELEIALDISNINLAGEGLNTIEGVLEYNHNVFEKVENSNFTSLNGWAFTYNDEDSNQNGKFLGILLSEGVKTNQTIAKIKLKAKTGINDQNATIKIKDIKSNDGENIVTEIDKEISIKIEKKQNSGNPSGQGNSNNNGRRNSRRKLKL